MLFTYLNKEDALTLCDTGMEELPTFRAPKRRKTAQRRQGEDETGIAQGKEDRVVSEATNTSGEEEVAGLVQIPKPFRRARPGIKFSTNSRPNGEQTEFSALVPADTSNERLSHMSSRFVGSGSGQVVDVDKHMYVCLAPSILKE